MKEVVLIPYSHLQARTGATDFSQEEIVTLNKCEENKNSGQIQEGCWLKT